jgi:hypothetical protein
MDIYKILASKPHNPHHLNRYITFIKQCQQNNSVYEGYTERHHICPKAMFPKYKSFTQYRWNCAVLTARQHFIAHVMLWKIYENKSMTRAIGMMTDEGKIKKSEIYERIKIEYSVLVSLQMTGTVSIKTENGKSKRISKKEFDSNENLRGHTKGMTVAVDCDRNLFYVSSDDERLKSGILRGNNAGTITITDGVANKRIDPNSTIPDGWRRGMTKDSPKCSVWVNNGKTSKMIKGVIPDGWAKGRIFDKKPKHVGTRGKICINDGSVNKMIEKQDLIPDGWVRGRLHVK